MRMGIYISHKLFEFHVNTSDTDDKRKRNYMELTSELVLTPHAY